MKDTQQQAMSRDAHDLPCFDPLHQRWQLVRLQDGRASLSSADAVADHVTARSLPQKLYLLPGFADVHVHLREPGFSYKETIASGSRAAAHGGYSAVCTMPNLQPVPDSLEHLQPQLDLIARDAVVDVYPYGAISVGQRGRELAEMEELAPLVVAFSDDGRGVQSDELMRKAMLQAKRLGKLIVAHCEDDSLLHGGYIHDGDYARQNDHLGLSSESEWRQLERDLRLVAETGCSYHACHISCRRSVQLLRQAKAAGLDVSCETAPHYLLLHDALLQEEGRFRMNPPIRSRDDQNALIEGLLDDTVDMIATDHAPHAASEKAGGLRHSLNGIVGLETAFAVLYSQLVRFDVIDLPTLVKLLSDNPHHRFGLPLRADDFSLFDLERSYTIDPQDFLSLGRATPFAGQEVQGRCLLNVVKGRVAWQDPSLLELANNYRAGEGC